MKFRETTGRWGAAELWLEDSSRAAFDCIALILHEIGARRLRLADGQDQAYADYWLRGMLCTLHWDSFAGVSIQRWPLTSWAPWDQVKRRIMAAQM